MNHLTRTQKAQIKAEEMANKMNPIINHYYFHDGELFIIKSYSKLYVIGEQLKMIDNHVRDDDITYMWYGNSTKYYKFSNEVINKKYKIAYSSFYPSYAISNEEYNEETYFTQVYYNFKPMTRKLENNYSTSLFKNNKFKIDRMNFIQKSIYSLTSGMMNVEHNKEYYRPYREETLTKMFKNGDSEKSYFDDDEENKIKYLRLSIEYNNLLISILENNV
jgi:hypothetical protein